MSVDVTYTWKDIPYSSHEYFLNTIRTYGKDLRVLDVGPGNADLARRIRPECRFIAGIEKDASAASRARAFFDHLVVGDATYVDHFWQTPFDVIVLGDILEHTPEPAKILLKILSLLKKDGRLLVSLPNVANITVRMELLLGRFDYRDKGILDRTHLRFYTLKTAREELEKAGFVVCRTEATPMPVELAFPWLSRSCLCSPVRSVTESLARISPTLFGYQFLFEARPRG